MTELDLIARVKRHLAGTDQYEKWRSDDGDVAIASMIPEALKAVADIAASDPSLDALLTQNYSVTLSSGVGSLLSTVGVTTGVADISLQRLPFLSVKDNSNNILKYVRTFAHFNQPLPTVYGYYTVVNQQLHTRAANSDQQAPPITGASTPVIVTAHFIPSTVPTVPNELNATLINALGRLLLREDPRLVPAAAEAGIALQPAA